MEHKIKTNINNTKIQNKKGNKKLIQTTNKGKNLKKYKKQDGITLIALIVTIIVLLI